jgi:hypothetical protein
LWPYTQANGIRFGIYFRRAAARRLGARIRRRRQGRDASQSKQDTEAEMSRGFSSVSDVIALKSLHTGGQSVGNGGDGTSSGAIINKPTLSFDPTNKADGASVSVHTGDHVKQSADWDAGGANTKASLLSTAHGGDADSNGSQKSYSGYDTSKVYANTDATQINKLSVDMHQDVAAGIGGDGGSDNLALGGDVTFNSDIGFPSV